jgi:hypothetical protein
LLSAKIYDYFNKLINNYYVGKIFFRDIENFRAFALHGNAEKKYDGIMKDERKIKIN